MYNNNAPAPMLFNFDPRKNKRKLMLHIPPDEKMFFAKAKQRFTASGCGECVMTNPDLQIGDFMWTYFDDHKRMFGPLGEIKRKKDADASLFDTRYAEQKARLFSLDIPHSNILFFYEGTKLAHPPSEYRRTAQTSASLLGSIVATNVRDGCVSIHTDVCDDTVDLICLYHWKLQQIDDPAHVQKMSYHSYLQANAVKKDMRADHALENMLAMLVDGVSVKMGQVIAARFKSIGGLYAAFLRSPSQTRTIIANMQHEDKCYGPAVAQKITDLMGIETIRAEIVKPGGVEPLHASEHKFPKAAPAAPRKRPAAGGRKRLSKRPKVTGIVEGEDEDDPIDEDDDDDDDSDYDPHNK